MRTVFFRWTVKSSPARHAVLATTWIALILSLSSLSGCKREADTRSAADKGRTLYSLHCMTCHNVNPAKDGSLGPGLQAPSLELLQARIQRGEYPAGYTPKRSTRIMQKLPLTDEEVRSLHAYLNSL
jgi:mono/diheme cytochrome c family protein